MNDTIYSQRLVLTQLSALDSDFIFELVNTPGWIKYIGDRHVTSKETAQAFVLSVMQNQNVNYWVVRLKIENHPIGIISFVKRDYLEFSDVGFAFLPKYSNQGFAFEASQAFLNHLASIGQHNRILATTIPDNTKSISLLKKLGFDFEKQIENNGQELFIYSASISRFLLE
ncbi:MAG: GNAT family N-acetyltransferase [Cyclobacteriaceae bacterium]